MTAVRTKTVKSHKQKVTSTTTGGGKGERKTEKLRIKPKREAQLFIVNSLGRLVKVELKKRQE